MNILDILTIGLIAYLVYGALIFVGVIAVFIFVIRQMRDMSKRNDWRRF